MEIRRAALADIPGVCACCVAAFKDYIPLIGQTPGPMLEDYCQARKEHFLFVAAQGETILGYLLIKDGDGEVMWMDVLAAWPKGTGVGRRLINSFALFSLYLFYEEVFRIAPVYVSNAEMMISKIMKGDGD